MLEPDPHSNQSEVTGPHTTDNSADQSLNLAATDLPTSNDRALLTRREVLLGKIGYEVSTLEKYVYTLPLVVAPVMSLVSYSIESSDPINRNSPPKAKSGYSKIDENLTTPTGESFRNLGVTHVSSAYNLDGEHIRSAIRNADIVALEATQTVRPITWLFSLFARPSDAPLKNETKQKERLGETYFDELALYAGQQKKQVYNVDVNYSTRAFFYSIAMSLGAGLGARRLAQHEDNFLKTGKSDMALSRRLVLRVGTFIAGSLGICGLSDLANYAFSFIGLPTYNPWSASFIVNVRSINMLSNVIELCKANPGKRILVITGNVHAQEMTSYLDTPERFQTFSTKLAAYRAAYGKTFGLGMKRVTWLSDMYNQ